jgi:hypothetical protein
MHIQQNIKEKYKISNYTFNRNSNILLVSLYKYVFYNSQHVRNKEYTPIIIFINQILRNDKINKCQYWKGKNYLCTNVGT